MAIINDFKGIKDACNAISKSILGEEKPKDEMEIAFEADDELCAKVEAALEQKARWPSKTPTPPLPQTNPIPIGVGASGGGSLGGQAKCGQKAPTPPKGFVTDLGVNCPRCGCRLRMKARGPFCIDCDEYI